MNMNMILIPFYFGLIFIPIISQNAEFAHLDKGRGCMKDVSYLNGVIINKNKISI